MDKPSAKCASCGYRLWGRGPIGTLCFGQRHALRKQHLVYFEGVFSGLDEVTEIDGRGTLDVGQQPAEPPF